MVVLTTELETTRKDQTLKKKKKKSGTVSSRLIKFQGAFEVPKWRDQVGCQMCELGAQEQRRDRRQALGIRGPSKLLGWVGQMEPTWGWEVAGCREKCRAGHQRENKVLGGGCSAPPMQPRVRSRRGWIEHKRAVWGSQ